MKNKIADIKHDFNNQISIQEAEDKYKDVYEVILTWDSNDADYITQTCIFPAKQFDRDFTLKIVLSFVRNGHSGKLFGDHRNDAQYGNYIDDNTDIPELSNYLGEMDLVAYTSDGMCHSVDSVNIRYFDKNGKIHKVKLPEFDKFFNSKEEAVEVLNTLIEDFCEDD